MKYRTQTGFAAIRSMEPDQTLKEINQSLHGAYTVTITGAARAELSVNETTTVADLLEQAGSPNLKFVHVGAPLGVILSGSDLNHTLAELQGRSGVSFGSAEICAADETVCSVDYLRKLFRTLKEESCGRCVLCRLGLDQLCRTFDDAATGKGRSDDVSTLGRLARSMREAAYCSFGKAAGALLESCLAACSVEFEDHAKRKKCAAMVCKEYLTYHILGSKCTGCQECLDVCEADAITGKKKYIHMIDDFDCTRCGKCMDICEEDAIVLAGPVKPKTPTKLTKVGAWKGK